MWDLTSENDTRQYVVSLLKIDLTTESIGKWVSPKLGTRKRHWKSITLSPSFQQDATSR